MEFLSREEFKELARRDPDFLYDNLSKLFSEIGKTIEGLKSTIQLQEEKIRNLENRLNQNSKNSNKPPSSDQFKKEHSSRKTSRRKSGGQTDWS